VLIVRQTAQIHEQVARLLEDLKTIADQYGDDVFPVIEPVPQGFGGGFMPQGLGSQGGFMGTPPTKDKSGQ
jgi:hypothetical protein